MKYKVLSNLKRNGKTYGPDSEVELSEEAGRVLVKDGVLEVVKEETSEAPTEAPAVVPEETSKEAPDYSQKKVSELRALAEEKGISSKGLKKPELIEVLQGTETPNEE